MSRYFTAEVISNLSLNNKSNLLTIAPLKTVIDPEPGQFYMIEVGTSYDPLLKRPFSVFRKIPEGIQFLYRVIGRGTMLLKCLKDGAIINVLGPFGNRYPETESSKIPLLVAGGIGIASLFSLAETLSKKAYILYGARNKDELLMLDELKGLTDKLIISTDDGSTGEKGMISYVLNDFLTHHLSPNTHYLLYACGPKPMLEAVSRIAREKGVKGYMSVEENMACGVGACQGCTVTTVGGYKRVCKEGPVFPIEEIVW
ncbi:MAG: dihydroorotate dehydrogenase electron transfer subunit [Nitrospirota bacterium]|nr:dihydroorotate dehydrogenase electron transfer subunit [Nitrospirota bacterium]